MSNIKNMLIIKNKIWNLITITLFLFIFLILISKIHLALKYEINWDEFYYLSFVYKYINSQYLSFFQTFHVHFFSWLQYTSNNEVVQIIYARFVMIIVQIITCYYIFLVSRQFFGLNSSILSIITFQTFSYIINHGASFRTDPIAELFLAITTYFLIKKDFKFFDILLVSVCISLAGLITTKSVLFLPTYTIIIIVRVFLIKDITLLRLFNLIAISASMFCLLSFFHYSSINNVSLLKSMSLMNGAADKTLFETSFFPGLPYFVHSLLLNPLHWVVILLSVVRIFSCNKINKNNKIILFSLVLPTLSLLIYRNAFPYFYGFIFSPLAMIMGLFWSSLLERNKVVDRLLLFTILLVFFFNIYRFSYYSTNYQNNEYQRYFVDVVHDSFPSNVNYIDRCSMISSFNKTSFFMSSWGIEDYNLGNKRFLSDVIKHDNPVFYIENTPDLKVSNHDELLSRLNDNDIDFLKENYIEFWNQIRIAGKKFSLSEKDIIEFTIFIEGFYTIDTNGNIIIDGEIYSHNDVLYLTKGEHNIQSINGSHDVKIQWGKNIKVPTLIREEPIFTGF